MLSGKSIKIRSFVIPLPVEIKVMLSLLIIIAGVSTFLFLADLVEDGEVQQYDNYLLHHLRQKGHPDRPAGPQFLTEVMRDITALGGVTVITGMIAAISGFLFMQRKYRALAIILAASVGGALLSTVLKLIIARERPDLAYQLAHVSTHSFPSGHSMMSASVYLSIAALLARIQEKVKLRIYIIAVAFIITFLIGISRIYLGVHYLTDVLAGWSIGAAWASFCWFAAWYWEKRRGKRLSRPD